MFESFQKAAWEGKDCYCANATDKAAVAHNIQSDIVMDIIKANADTISGILEDGK